MNQQEKLRKKRLEQEQKIKARRKKIGIFNRFTKNKYQESDETREEKYKSSMDSHKETIPKEEINKVLEENPVTKEVPLIDGIPGESEEEKKDRISKLRTEIYENHKKTLNDKYTEAKEIIQKDTNKRITEAEEDYQKNVEVHKSDLEE